MTAEPLPPLLLVGAGRMGGAMFAGWSRQGLAPSVIVDPALPPGLARPQDRVVSRVEDVPADFAPLAVVLAIKPQMADGVLAALAPSLPLEAVALSIMAGKRIAGMRTALGGAAAVVRAMPNTPAAIGQGVTACCAGPGVTAGQRALCTALLNAVGEVVWLDDEALMDAVTAVSGSGPAYVFLLAELLEQAGIAQGLPAPLARVLARRTVSGAGALLAASAEDAAELRRQVTSPKGTTQAALDVLMAEEAWPRALALAVRAAARRAGELAI